jgi:PAS domain S-box-containing protein
MTLSPDSSPATPNFLGPLNRQILDQAGDTIAIFDLNYRYVYINPVIQTLIDMTPQDMVGKTDEELGIPDCNIEIWRAAWGRLLQSRQEQFVIFEYQTKLGPRNYESRLNLILDEGGEALYLFSITRDTTSQVEKDNLQTAFHQDMAALQYLHLELSEINRLDALYPAMIQMSREHMGIDRLALFMLDESQNRLQGTYGTDPEGQLREESYFQEDIPPGHWTEEILQSPQHTSLWEDTPLYDNWGQSGQGWKAGSALWNGYRAIGYLVCDNLLSGRPPRPYERELLSVLSTTFGHLIERLRGHEAQQAQEQLKLLIQKEQEQNAQTQRVVAALSHDIRGPLSSIRTSSDLLEQYADKLSPEKRREKFASIKHQVDFISQLLEETSILIRSNFGAGAFHPKPLNLEALCQLSLESAKQAHPGLVEAHFRNLSSLTMALADELLLSRVLLNLLGNALKYSPNGGQVSLELDLDPSQDWLIFRVQDQGLGIPESDLPHIFDPFFRATNAHFIKGTGLGLSIVKDAVESHGGRIQVSSQLGQGTRFTVEVPYQRAPTG